ncbi:MAG TPA: discoidin domain-containing protein [Polyangiaceae bacterium]|nr:discoidin domain-containing protein [Polyangiaceae bacterium]
MGACWFAACSFPAYELGPAVDPLASICTDGATSPAESGIDCGGGCPPCGVGQTCKVHQDCASLSCADGVCQLPSCEDGVKNGAEADTDCGGQCEACPPGRDCQQDKDCAEGVCESSFCQVPTCHDGLKNGVESGVDCGSGCKPCENGEGCAVNDDCKYNHCSENVCVKAGCADGMMNDLETDQDCGGSECGPCQPNKHCVVGPDCTSHICADGSCTAYGCDDGVLNGDETAIDCGGANCVGCLDMQPCETGKDCQSTVCLSSLCVPKSPTGTVLSRTGWSAKASDSYVDDNPVEVLDSQGGRWTSGTPQRVGMWLEVDMGELKTFFSVVLDCQEAPADAPGQFSVYLSVDGEYDKPAVTGVYGGAISTVKFDTAQLARYVKIELTQAKTKWWSINELNVVQ